MDGCDVRSGGGDVVVSEVLRDALGFLREASLAVVEIACSVPWKQGCFKNVGT